MLLLLAPLLLYALGSLVEGVLGSPADADSAPVVVFRRCVVGLLLVGWAGVTLAEVGRFSALGLTAAIGLAGVVLALGLGWRAPAGWRSVGRALRGVGRWGRPGELAALVALLALAAALFWRPGEDVLGARDPGIYFATGAAIAREGGILQTDPALRLLARDLGDASVNYWLFQSLHGWPLRFPGQLFVRDLGAGLVEPGFLPWYPVWIAYAIDAAGSAAGLWVNPALATLGLLAVYFAGRLIVGPLAAGLGAALLAINLGQVWFTRYTMAEPGAQLLVWVGLYALAAAHRQPSAALGLLAGLAWGSSLLARVDAVVLVPPVALYLAWQARWPERRRFALVALGMLAILALQAGLHAWQLAPGYHSMVFSRATLAVAAGGVALVLVLAAATWLLAAGPRPGGRDWRPALVLGLLVLGALFAYLVRPALPAPALSGEAAELEAAARESLVRLGWYVTPLGLALALVGAALLARPPRRTVALPLLGLFAVSLAFYLPNPLVSSDQPWAVRRYLPLVLPGVLLLAAYGAVEGMGLLVRAIAGVRRPGGAFYGSFRGTSPPAFGSRGRDESRPYSADASQAYRFQTAALAIALCGLVAWGEWQATGPLVAYREHAGALGQVEALAALVPEDAIVLFPRSSDGMRLSLPLHYLGGRRSFVLPAEGPEEGVMSVVRRWRAAGLPVYWVVPLGSRFPTPPGARFVPAGLFTFEAPQLERPLDRLPVEAPPLRFDLQLYRLELASGVAAE